MSENPDCGVCGMPYHRYADNDPEHKHSYTACINAMRGRIEQLSGHECCAQIAEIRRYADEMRYSDEFVGQTVRTALQSMRAHR